MAAASGILFSFPVFSFPLNHFCNENKIKNIVCLLINWENMLNHCHKFCEARKAYSILFLIFEFQKVHDAMKRVEFKEFICNRFVM